MSASEYMIGDGFSMGIICKVSLLCTKLAPANMAAGGSTSSNLLVLTHVLAFRTAKQ